MIKAKPIVLIIAAVLIIAIAVTSTLLATGILIFETSAAREAAIAAGRAGGNDPDPSNTGNNTNDTTNPPAPSLPLVDLVKLSSEDFILTEFDGVALMQSFTKEQLGEFYCILNSFLNIELTKEEQESGDDIRFTDKDVINFQIFATPITETVTVWDGYGNSNSKYEVRGDIDSASLYIMFNTCSACSETMRLQTIEHLRMLQIITPDLAIWIANFDVELYFERHIAHYVARAEAEALHNQRQQELQELAEANGDYHNFECFKYPDFDYATVPKLDGELFFMVVENKEGALSVDLNLFLVNLATNS
jgi:hypothetical protein